jgi:serine/threonine-protein kinase
VDTTAADVLIGRVLDGRYRIESRVAPGGMATVYRATDLRLHRSVAVKVMKDALAEDPDYVDRFLREGRSAAALSHHNIVSIFDQGEDDGLLFIAMELIEGRTLRDIIRAEGPLEPHRALSIMEPVVSALAAAHRAGVVHRDVKPENVLIADDGRIKVADFGLARSVDADSQQVPTQGVVIGSVSYLAPEVLESRGSGPRADVYAAGVMLFEMLTATKPHQGDSPLQIAYQHVHADVPPPSELMPGIPDYLDALVTCATSRDPNRRPADATVLMRHTVRVRDALNHGVASDPELTGDLTPSLPTWLAEDPNETEHDGTTVIDLMMDRESPLGVPPPVSPPVSGQVSAPLSGPVPTSVSAPVSALTPPPPGHSPPGRDDQRRRRKRGRRLLVLTLLLAVVAGGLGWYYGVARYTSTPSLIDLTQADAKTKLDAAGLSLNVSDRQWSDTIKSGHVISSDPAPGGRILHSGTVNVVLSRGPERHPVPDLSGMTVDQASTALAQVRLVLGTQHLVFNRTVPQGEIVRSNPAVGAVETPDTVIDIYVSKGPKPLAVTDYTGQSADTATTELQSAGFKVKATKRFSDTVPLGNVISQNPSSGVAYKGDTITLVVSKGSKYVQVPDVTSMKEKDAISKLKGDGFKVDVQKASNYFGIHYVASQNPSGGQSALRGSTVTIYIV